MDKIRLIDANALKEEVNKKRVVGRFNVLNLIDNAPTIKEPIKALVRVDEKGNLKIEPLRTKGEWIKEVFDCVSYKCSVCKTSYHMTMFANFNYCPNCGADNTI